MTKLDYTLITPEDMHRAFDGNPFVLKPPTRRAFPGGLREAVAYYEGHHATCVAAENLLGTAAAHCQKLADASRACVDAFSQLTAAEFAELEAHGMPEAMAKKYEDVANAAAPHVITFTSAAREYGARRELLERTLAALRAAL